MAKTVSIMILTFLVSGCVLKSTHDEILSDREGLQGRFQALEKKNQSLQEELSEARADLNETKARNVELSKMNDILSSKNQRFSQLTLDQQQELLRLKEEKLKTEEKMAFVTKTYDDFVQTLKNEIQDGAISVFQDGEKLSVNVSDRVLFPSGSDEIQSSGKKVLEKVVSVLKKTQNKKIYVEGHTDNVPISKSLQNRFPSNWELSTSRATKVVRNLESSGIEPERLAAVGYGPYRPKESNDTQEGRKKNRRIEIILLPDEK